MFLRGSILFILFLVIVAQNGIKNRIHATPDPRVIIISFSYDASVIFSSVAYLNSAINVTLTSSTATLPSYTSTLSFVNSDKKAVMIVLSITSIPYQTTMYVDFPSTSPSTGIYLTSPRLTLTLTPYSALSTDESDLLDKLTLAETISQYLWMTFATFAMLVYPYSQIYLNIKLMMETADILRTANIGYNNFLLNFWKKNNNQAAGLKFINFISIYAEGNSFNPGYTRDESYITSSRIGNYQFTSLQNYHRIYNFPLFFDAWGTNFFVIAVLLIILGLLELIRICVRRRHGNLKGFLVHRMRIWIRWNLIFAVFFGSSASIFYNSIVQFFASANSDSTTDMKINLGFGVSIFVIWVFGMIAALLWLIEASSLKKEFSDYYQIMNQPYKKGNKYLNLNFIFLILKYVIFTVIVMFSDANPLAQGILLIIFECFYIIYLIIGRPFSNRRCLVFQFIYETAFLLYVVLLTVLGKLDNSNDYTSNVRDTVCNILVYLWMVFPYLGALLGFIEIFAVPWLEPKAKVIPTIDMLVKTFDKQFTGVHSRYSMATNMVSENSIEDLLASPFYATDWGFKTHIKNAPHKHPDHRRLQHALDAQLAKLGKKSSTAQDPENASLTVSVDEIDFLPYRLQYDKGLNPPKVSYPNRNETFLSSKAREVSKTVYINENILPEIPEAENYKSNSPDKNKPIIFQKGIKSKMPEVSIKPFHTINKTLTYSPSPNQSQILDNSIAPMIKPFNEPVNQEPQSMTWNRNTPQMGTPNIKSFNDVSQADQNLVNWNQNTPGLTKDPYNFKIFEKDAFKFNPEDIAAQSAVRSNRDIFNSYSVRSYDTAGMNQPGYGNNQQGSERRANYY